jgi:stage II sporulation protein D
MSRTRVLAAAVAVALAGFVAPSPSYAADPPVTVPNNAWITITGHGYGHGHGMSQYGAEGAAQQGLTAQKIVDFYYPGTTAAQLTGYVSVRITADSDDNTIVLPRTGLQARDLATGEAWTLPANGATRWRLSVGSAGASRISYRAAGAWHSFQALTGDGAFTAMGRPITLVTPGNVKVRYRGALRSLRPSAGSTQRDTVNVLLLDQYLKGVVPREMPASWHPAAVQAQAIAARTYAAYEMAHPLTEAYQICDTTSCQVYGGYDSENDLSNAAVKTTAGMIQTYDGEPAFTQFSSSSGGWTSAGSVPYLTAEDDPWDDWAGNAMHTWTVKIDATKIERTWPKIGNLKAIDVLSRDGHGEWGGRIRNLMLHGGKADVTVSGDDFRYLLGLRSPWLRFQATAK